MLSLCVSLTLFVSFIQISSAQNNDDDDQSLQWYGLEPYATKPMISMFAAIYENRLYLVGGIEDSVTTLDLSDIFMNDYRDRLQEPLYQPDLNVQDNTWQTEQYWFPLFYGLFCNQTCTTQIDNLLYIVAPFRNKSNVITKTSVLYVYDLEEYLFSQVGNDIRYRITTFEAEYSCVLNNDTHIFMIGGGDYSNTLHLFDIENKSFVQMGGTMNIGRNNFGCSWDLEMSRIFVFGGDTAWNASTSTIEVYSVENDTWSLLVTYDTKPPTAAPTARPTTNSSSSSTITTTATTPSPTSINDTYSPTNQPTNPPSLGATPITLSFRRSKHNAILDRNKSEIYIFGGGGCSEVDNVCINYRSLVEVFDINTYTVRSDKALLKSAVSHSYSSLYWQYEIESGEQAGSWFDGIFMIGGNTEQANGDEIVQYRITDYHIQEQPAPAAWTPNGYDLSVGILVGIGVLVLLIAVIYTKRKRYSDLYLYSFIVWFVYFLDVVFDLVFNVYLWVNQNYGSATFTLVFILMRLGYNIGYQLRLSISKWKQDITIRERVKEYLYTYAAPFCPPHRGHQWLIYVMAICSGSSHGLINLLNSNLFGLNIFNMGLVKRHLVEYNLTRIPSEVIVGNIPQLTVQLLYMLEWGIFGPEVGWACLTTFLSIAFGIIDIWYYRHSHVALRRLMLEEDFTKPFFLIFKSDEIQEIGHSLIHKPANLIHAVSQMIDVPPETIEINLCQVMPDGIKVSFVEYSGTKNASEIIGELSKCIQDGWFQSSIKIHWRLREEPQIEIWDEQSMYEHRQLLTMDLATHVRTSLYQRHGSNCYDKCCELKCCKILCGCSCCHQYSDMIRASVMHTR